eukprot:852085-Rhodomonas_salina.1
MLWGSALHRLFATPSRLLESVALPLVVVPAPASTVTRVPSSPPRSESLQPRSPGPPPRAFRV